MHFLTIFLDEEQKKSCAIFLALFLFYTLFNIIVSSCLFFIQNFPNNYAWTELFINYEDGFIRRGLIGQLLFIVSHYIDTRIATFLLFFPFYVLFIKSCIKLFSDNIDKISLLLIIISPGLIFFFSQDQRMLCKKDLFYELGFIIQFLLLMRKDISLLRLFSLLVIIYMLCLVIHESTIFYSILPFSVFLEKANKEKKFFRYLCFLLIIAFVSVLYLFSFSGTETQSKHIFHSWNQLFSLTEIGALRYIGMPLSVKIAEEKIYYTFTTTVYIFIGILLTSLPLICSMINIHAIYRIKKFFCSNFTRVLVAFGFLAPWILPFIAIDFGRHIHTAILNQISFIATIACLTGGLENTEKKQYAKFSKATWLAISAYAFGWKLWHFAPCGNIVTLSFPIRIFTIGWIPSLNP